MDWLQFISSVIGSVAWPTAIVVAMLLFRQKLNELLPQMRFKHGDTELSFRLNAAEQEAAALPGPAPDAVEAVPTPEEAGRFEEILNASPRAAILEERVALEDALRRKVAEVDPDRAGKKLSVLGMIRFLRDRDVVDEHLSRILDDLRNVGNVASHSVDTAVTREDAVRYAKLAKQAMAMLRLF